jgi:Monooxygenase af470-like
LATPLEAFTVTTKVERHTVDLSGFPELVVIYLGMRVNRMTGLKTLFGFGPKISASVEAQPDGLLLHETIVYSLFPAHVGMRQYWRDMASLLEWTRSEPHRAWWKNFLRDSGGTGFWHETYLMQGGMEAIYDDIPQPIGMMKFAPMKVARGAMFGAAHRAGKSRGEDSVVSETELYGT